MICKYRAYIAGNKLFMREYEINSETRLFKLHEFLLRDLGFSPDQMTVFSTLNLAGKVLRRFGLFDLGDGSMDMITVGDTLSAGEEILQYTYNIGLQLSIILTYQGEGQYNPHVSYPCLTAEKGPNPDQFSAAYEDYEEHSEHSHSSNDEEDDDEEYYDSEELPEGEENV